MYLQLPAPDGTVQATVASPPASDLDKSPGRLSACLCICVCVCVCVCVCIGQVGDSVVKSGQTLGLSALDR